MKLVHPEIEGQIIIDTKKPCFWVIESPSRFSKVIQELLTQVDGTDGNFVLSEKEKEYDISKCVEVIVNPFAVNINDKKILNRLYSELSELAYGETLYLETQKMLSDLQNYFLKVEQESFYVLGLDETIDVSLLWKLLGVKFESYAEDFFETIIQYIKVISMIMKRKLVIFVNLCSYLTEIQVKQLLETANYEEISILFIENTERIFSNEFVKYIIDSDECEIY